MKAYRSRERNPATGRYLITFNPVKNLIEGSSLSVPCGRCTGCKLERSRQWALRIKHEAQLHPQNCFITLTFSKEHLPADYSVDVRHLQLFFKKLRKSLGTKKIRFYACGEYGEENLRPHYHAVVFNHDFAEKVHYDTNKRGDKIYTSTHLSKVWPYGLATLGDVTFESAAYVARYCTKKITGEPALDHYTRVHPDSRTVHIVRPEFAVMSRRPGIGAPWIERFRSDVYPSDFIVERGMKMNPPRFYDQQLTEEELTQIKRRRKATGLLHRADTTPERLRVRETVKLAKLKALKRSLKGH